MKKVSFDIYKKNILTMPEQKSEQFNTTKTAQQKYETNTIRGILLNNYIKDDKKEDVDSFETISTQLLIPENYEEKKIKNEDIESTFNYKNILKPLALTTGVALGGIIAISFCMKNYSKYIATKAGTVVPADLARNINIVEEPHLAMYRALRQPDAKNVLGLAGIGLMTLFTVCAKNFIDGLKEVWIKKQNCDIEHDLQKKLIDVESEAFAGKLKVVNTLLVNTTDYFKSVLKEDGNKDTNFKSFLNFKGKEKEIKENKEKEKTQNTKFKLGLGIIAGTIGLCALSLGLFKNFQKTSANLNNYYTLLDDAKIKSEIENAINNTNKKSGIESLIQILKTINAKEETMRTNLSKIKDITQDEIEQAIKEIKSAQIYAQAPEALGGISEKIQYYCYINEERGHLYNWILNPENEFNKYLFLSFCAVSSIGYMLKTATEAIKNVMVGKENSKSELELRKQLVQVEINNFKAKKLSAINPMLENFKYQAQKGKSKKELKQLAENILVEIKNGPPYIYS